MRNDGRSPNELRPIRITPHVQIYAEGSVEISYGKTKVLCSASVEPGVPKWLQGSGSGWVTAEYGMLPRSTHERLVREKTLNSGRTQEISRLIGRSLRAAVDLNKLGERQIAVDCDVLQADGGTRTAAVTGGFVALVFALDFLRSQGAFNDLPLNHYVAGVSVGLMRGEPLLDLNYEEDSQIGTDLNLVMTDQGDFVELQGTAEGAPLSRQQLDKMLAVADQGFKQIFIKQSEVIGSLFKPRVV